MNLPSLRQLQYLIAVVELKHFAHAAKRCYVTQSTLSAGIQELENLLGVTLLERSKRKVIPTLLGEQLAKQAQHILLLTGDLVKTATSNQQPLSGVLRLGVIPTIGPFLLPSILPSIRQRYPQLKLQLIEEQSARLLTAIAQGQLDAAILAFPYPITDMESCIFWQENFLLALPKQHYLANNKNIASNKLPINELLLLKEGHCLTDHALAACQLSNVKKDVVFQGTSLHTLLQMVIGGLGITFIPEMAAKTQLTDQMVLLPLAETGPHRKIGLVWRQSYFQKDNLLLLANDISAILNSGKKID